MIRRYALSRKQREDLAAYTRDLIAWAATFTAVDTQSVLNFVDEALRAQQPAGASGTLKAPANQARLLTVEFSRLLRTLARDVSIDATHIDHAMVKEKDSEGWYAAYVHSESFVEAARLLARGTKLLHRIALAWHRRTYSPAAASNDTTPQLEAGSAS
jgi:hypothetical protein